MITSRDSAQLEAVLKLRSPNNRLIKNLLHLVVPYDPSELKSRDSTYMEKVHGPMFTDKDMKELRVQGQILKILGFRTGEVASMYTDDLISILIRMLGLSKIEAYAVVIASIALPDAKALKFIEGSIQESKIDVHNYRAMTLLFRWADTLTPEETSKFPKVFNTASESVNHMMSLIKEHVDDGTVNSELMKVLSSAVLEASFTSNWQPSFTSLIDAAMVEIAMWPKSDKVLAELGPLFGIISPYMTNFIARSQKGSSLSDILQKARSLLASIDTKGYKAGAQINDLPHSVQASQTINPGYAT